MPKDPYDFEYGNVVFKTTIDVCKVFNGVVATFVVKAVLEHFEKTADIGAQCPFVEVWLYSFFNTHFNNIIIFINQGYYNLTNLKLADMFYPLQKNKFEVTCKVLGKVTDESVFVHLFTFKGYGEYK